MPCQTGSKNKMLAFSVFGVVTNLGTNLSVGNFLEKDDDYVDFLEFKIFQTN